MPRARHAAVMAFAALTLGACAAGGPASPSVGSAQAPTPALSASPPPSGIDLGDVPTACIGLGADDCRRVVAEVGELVPAGVAPRYVQVGPFGCSTAQPCAQSLADRAEGDVTIEAGAGALFWHVKATAGGGPVTYTQQDPFGVRVGPGSQPPITAGARPYTLGHCGIWSGIDAGGSWWDPVGQIDGDHTDAINSAEGTLAILDPDHATFTSKNGFTVQLVRRDGEKYLPLCQ